MLPKHGNNNGIFGRNRNDLLKNQQLQFTSSAAKLDFPTLSPQQEYEDEYQPADYGNIYEHNNIENDKFKMQKQMAYLIENK
jgi:tryptophan synthase beta subunit